MTISPQAPLAKEPPFSAPSRQWWLAIAYCLLLSLVGLRFWPALLFVAVFLLWRWKTERYAFVVETMLLFGGYAMFAPPDLPFKTTDVALILGIIGAIVYRKNPMVMKVTAATLAYFATLLALALTSVESLSVQFLMMRNYLAVIAFFVPLLAFAGCRFSWHPFIRCLVIHVLVICGFYVVDTFIFSGFVLLPASDPWRESSTFYHLNILPFDFPRHYPPGLYWLAALIVPITSGALRLRPIHWLLIILAIISARTNTLLFTLLVCFALFQPKAKRVILIAVAGITLVTAGYFIDKSTGRHLRLANNIEQFVDLRAARDNEDLAEFGTGRMAQILPKWELLDNMHRLWIGFGFLHATKTTNPIFQIENEYYSDISKADETATAVEVTQVQTILDCGFIGLIAQTLYFLAIFFIIRPTKRARPYLCTVVAFSILGVGGFSGLINPAGLYVIATLLAAAMLNWRTENPDPRIELKNLPIDQ